MYKIINEKGGVEDECETKLKKDLLKYLGCSNFKFLEEYSIKVIIDWLLNEGYIDKVCYSLKDVCKCNISQDTRDSLKNGKELNKEEDYYIELIESTDKIEVYKIVFNYNFLIEDSNEYEKARTLNEAKIKNKKRKDKVKKDNILSKLKNLRKLNRTEKLWRYNEKKEYYLVINVKG